MTPLLPTLIAALSCQPVPAAAADFSGVWRMDAARSESAAQGAPASAPVVQIVQTGSSLQVATTRDGRPQTEVYPIQALPAAPGDPAGQNRAFWQDGKLVSEGSVEIEGRPISFREVRTPQAGGNEMMVETTVKVEHGYQMQGLQTMATGKNIYVRAR